MKKPPLTALASALLPAFLVSCVDPLPPPPPRFRPNPPYAPTPVDAYGNPIPAYRQDQDLAPPPPTSDNPQRDYNTPIPTRPGEYPVAKRTSNPDEVESPYEPYNIINVEGYRSGELVRDPHNKKIFRVP